MENDRGKQRIEDALAAAAPAIWDWDAAAQSFNASAAFLRLHGFPSGAPVTLDLFAGAIAEGDAGWTTALRAGEKCVLPATIRYRIRRADALRWIRARLTVVRDPASEALVSVTGIAEDVTEVEEATDRLRESEERLRLAIEAGRMAVWEVELGSGKLTQSPELNALLELPPEAKPTLWDVRQLYAPGEIDRLTSEGVTLEAVRNRSAQGEYATREEAAAADRTQIQAEFALVTPAGTHKRLLLRAQFAPRPVGNPMVTGVLVDVTEQARARDRLAVVARELRHRIKNTIAIVKALAYQTLRNRDDPEEALDTYNARLQALALATDSILAEDRDRTDLLALARNMTSPYRDVERDNLAISGEAIALSPRQASAIGMVLHEFSTNAVKYGALSVPGGRVALTWRREDGGQGLALEWQESGGPPVAEPGRLGFGSRLIRALVTSDLGGSLDIRYPASGFLATITLPLAGLGHETEGQGAGGGPTG